HFRVKTVTARFRRLRSVREQQAIEEPETAERRDAGRGGWRESRSAAQVRQQGEGGDNDAHLTTFNSQVERDQACGQRRAGKPQLTQHRSEAEAMHEPEGKAERPAVAQRRLRASAPERPEV